MVLAAAQNQPDLVQLPLTLAAAGIFVSIIGIFILPPDYITLEERLINRQKDSSTTIKQRMDAALDEISHYKEFDLIVVNDKFDETVAKLNEIISDPKTDHNRRNSSHDDFISKIMAQRD